MITYPISFHSESHSASGIQSPWTTISGGFENRCAIPPEFEGPGGALSPEDLFAQALANCFVATFKVYAEKSRIPFGIVSAQAELIADLDEAKKPVMKKCILRVRISGVENTERAKTIAEKAFASGFILRSVKTEVSLDLQISEDSI